ncbi:hypothetical protein MPSEU_000908400 [Mayamaea pseudoterrestris]|nr:hypothetical protein MPSEU_000908400 [Mayamaea pseudoterrestris]
MPGHSHSHHHGASPLQEKRSGCCGGSESAGTIDSEPTLTTRSSEHHHSHTHHHHHHAEEEESNSVLCLAVVRENGTDVVIFDASGVPMTFRYQKNEASSTAANGTSDDKDSQVLQQQKLCFSTHGATAIDDWMTPCFDEHGNHGTPAESCFCGVDTPHVHAHLRNMCLAAHQQQQERDTAMTTTTSSSSKDGYGLEQLLASQTLYLIPTGTTDTDEDDAAACNLLVLPVSDSLPKACNSQEIQKRFNAAKCRKTHQHDSTCSSATAAYKDYKNSKARRILHKVRHDDHEDYLVHNADTGELHLEHACADCGSDDVHGRFQNVGQRKWRNKRRGSSSSSFKHVQLHFFEVSPTPFSILDHLPNLFDTKTSGRVATVENILKTATAATTTPVKAAKPAHVSVPTIEPPLATATLPLARSILSCDKICCSSEVPMIRRVLEPMPGVEKVMVNVPLCRMRTKTAKIGQVTPNVR